MIRRIALGTGLSVLIFGIGASGALARSATVGQLFQPTGTCSGQFTYLQTASPSSIPYTIPFDGVITTWSWYAGATPVTGLKLKVGHSVGGQYAIDAEAPAGAQTPNTATAYPANIPVKAGEIIGITQNGGDCTGTDDGYTITGFGGDLPPSSNPQTPAGTVDNFVLPVQASVTETQAPTPAPAPPAKHKKKRCKHKKKHHSAQSAKKKKCKKKKRK